MIRSLDCLSKAKGMVCMFVGGKCNIRAFIALVIVPIWVHNEGIYKVV
jgi:hypothetical protein